MLKINSHFKIKFDFRMDVEDPSRMMTSVTENHFEHSSETVIGNGYGDENDDDDDEDDTSESDDNNEPDEEIDQDNGDTDEESIADEGGGGDDDDDSSDNDNDEQDEDEQRDNASSMSESEQPIAPEENGHKESVDDEDDTEDSPKTTTTDDRSEEPSSANVSPENPQKRGRGRPKKILKDNADILDALDESYHDKPKRSKKEVNYGSDDDEEMSESDDEEEDDDERPSKKSRIAEDDNIRRSGRERKAPKKFEAVIPKKKKKKKRRETSESEPAEEDDDSDYDSRKRKSKKSKKQRDKFGIYKKTTPTKVKRKQKKVISEEEDEGENDSDESDNEYSRSWKNKMKRNKQKGKITAADYGGDKKSSRNRKTTKYQEEETSHSSDVASDYDAKEAEAEAAEEEEQETIEAVLDYRSGKVGATGISTMFWSIRDDGDPNITLETEETEDQFYIKWKGWSHINNTWESETSLAAKKKGDLEVKGIRKLTNYQLKLGDYKSWKKFANPEDVEYQEIELEMKRQLLFTYTDVERIFSHRKNESDTNDYYVKWKNLSYAESTWEDESVIKSYYSEALDEYNTRRKLKCNPRCYKESMKFFKKTFKPLKEQPSFIGSEQLRLRDYQMDGINFMLKAWHNGDSLILADEMGLGKTIQSISFLKYLFHVYPFKGPMLVVVPLSTMAAWQKEFATWAPEMNMICYNGTGPSRDIIRQFECENTSGELTFNALLTNYEMVCKDRTFFQDIVWSNIVVDEAHR